jgi:hypothetical protein
VPTSWSILQPNLPAALVRREDTRRDVIRDANGQALAYVYSVLPHAGKLYPGAACGGTRHVRGRPCAGAATRSRPFGELVVVGRNIRQYLVYKLRTGKRVAGASATIWEMRRRLVSKTP